MVSVVLKLESYALHIIFGFRLIGWLTCVSIFRNLVILRLGFRLGSWGQTIRLGASSFFSSHLFSSPFFSLTLLVVTQIQVHIAGSPPPSPLRFAPCTFIAIIFQPFLPSLTRVELCLPKLGVLSKCWSVFHFCRWMQNLLTAGFELTGHHH